MSLTKQARQLYDNRRMAAKWILAVRYLRSRNLWVLDKSKTPSWGIRQEAM